jgi:hypothetical protein
VTSLRDRTIAAVEAGYEEAVKDRFKMIGSVPEPEKTFEDRFSEALKELTENREWALGLVDSKFPPDGKESV